MNRDEVWEKIKSDKSTVYGRPLLDVFLETTEDLDPKHWRELSADKRRLLSPDIRLGMASTPREAEEAVKDGAEDTVNGAYRMGKNGSKDALEWLLSRRSIFNKDEHAAMAFNGAAVGGHKGIMEWIMGMGRGFWDANDALISASSGGQAEIARWLATKGADNFNVALQVAAKSGNAEIVNWALNNNAKCCGEAARAAAEGGRLEMVKWLIGMGRVDQEYKDAALWGAAAGGHSELTRWLAENASKKHKWAFAGAVLNNQEETARVLLGLGVDPDEALLVCAENGRTNFFDMVVKAGATDLNGALDGAIRHDKAAAAKWLIERGANNLEDALAKASSRNQHSLANYIRERLNAARSV